MRNKSQTHFHCSYVLRFSLTKYEHDDSDEMQDALLHLFRMFLLGSRNMRILDVPSESAFLDIVLDVLKTNPTCFDKLEETVVHFTHIDIELEKILEVSMPIEMM
jgi:hypothetical protein